MSTAQKILLLLAVAAVAAAAGVAYIMLARGWSAPPAASVEPRPTLLLPEVKKTAVSTNQQEKTSVSAPPVAITTKTRTGTAVAPSAAVPLHTLPAQDTTFTLRYIPVPYRAIELGKRIKLSPDQQRLAQTYFDARQKLLQENGLFIESLRPQSASGMDRALSYVETTKKLETLTRRYKELTQPRDAFLKSLTAEQTKQIEPLIASGDI